MPEVRRENTVTDTEEGRTLLQTRLSLFGFALFSLAFVSWAALALAFVFGSRGPSDAHSPFSFAGSLHLTNALLAGLLWVLTRRGRRSGRTLHWLDVSISLGLIAVWALAGMTIPEPAIGGFVALLSYVVGSLARAIVVPSTAQRTLHIAGLGAAMIVGAAAYRAEHTVAGVLASAIATACWSATCVTLAVIASHTIFGLRREVQRASVLGQYTLETKIGEGGMGSVWRASHALLRRPTAIKLVRASHANDTSVVRFEREVQLTASLTHPNAVAIYDYGRTRDGVFYYAMELLDGWDLERLVRAHGPMPPERVIHVLVQICGALAEAHDLGLVHRDVKPANVLLAPRRNEHEIAKIVDFGLVKEVSTEGAGEALTGETKIAGTPLYMAPEAIAAPDQVDGRTDIYALGAVAWFLLVGRTPFEGKSVVEICSAHLHVVPKAPSAEAPLAAIPKALDDVVLACLAKKKDERPATARALRDALAACSTHDAWTPARAEAWWATHERAKKDHVEASSVLTLEVDVARRDDKVA